MRVESGGKLRGSHMQNHCNKVVAAHSIGAVLSWGIEMRRDHDYSRALLLELEADEDWLHIEHETLSDSPDERKRFYHIYLLVDEGFLVRVSEAGYRLHNDAHDFLDLTRQDATWKAVKDAARALPGAGLGILRDVAFDMARKAIPGLVYAALP